jgi:two-component system LytT family response regulator
MLKTVIIENETLQMEYLEEMLQLYCPEVEIIARIYSAHDAISSLPTLNPDLVFLDINLGDGTAFDILSKINGLHGSLVFTTAFAEHAIEAFKVNAIDYLLKPVDPDELRKAVQKALLQHPETSEPDHTLLSLADDKSLLLVISEKRCNTYIPLDEILFCESDGNYTYIHHILNKSEEKTLSTKTLKWYETELQPHGFIRIHQSFMVNKLMIRRFDKISNQILLSNGVTVPVARNRKDTVLQSIIKK